MKFMYLVFVFLAGVPASADSMYPRKDYMLLDTNKPGLEIAVFNNANEPKPRCLCSTFSVFVREAKNSPIGSPSRIEKLQVIERQGGKIVNKSTFEERTSLFRSPGSPWYTSDQYIIMTSSPELVKDKSLEIQALSRKCLNPTQKECKKLVVVAAKKISALVISALNPKTPLEVNTLLKSDDETNSETSRGGSD